MKRRQRFITMMFLLGICMLAKAGDVNQVGSIWYDIDISTKTASVVANPTGGKYVGEVNIPATINFDGTVRVIAIGADAFKSSTLLTKVTMTSQITSIGKSAFDGCTALEEVSGYTNVTSIGQYAFSGCSKLTEFHIYSALTTVGKSAFYNCTGLQAVYAEEMGTFGSINFTNDNDGTVNQSNPLYYAKRLYQYDYSRRMWLPTMNLRASYAGSDGTIKGNTYVYAKCHTVQVVSGVKTISHAAFRNCEVEELILPSSLEELGSYCFAGCTKLKRVSCAATTPPTVKANRPSFDGVDLSKVTLYVPSASVDAYKAHATWKKFDVKPIPTTVDTKTFGGITMQLKATSTASVVSFDASVLPPNVHIPDYIAYNGYTYPVTSIREFAFEKCDMSTIDLPTDISYIGSCAFKDCKNLVEVYMDKAIKNIDSNPFKGCISLQKVRITTATPPAAPNDWENIGNATLEVPPSSVSAYSSTAPWSGFKSVSELTGEHFWYKGIRYFLNYDGTASVTGFNEEEMDEDVVILSTLPLETNYTVTSIADRAFQSGFYNWETYKWEYTSGEKIKSIVIPGTVKTIGIDAFLCCTSLQSVVLGNGIEDIKERAFSQTSLIRLSIPGSVKTIGIGAFADCKSLTHVSLSFGLESLGGYVFDKCNGITTLDLPASLTELEYSTFNSFRHMGGLRSITVAAGNPVLSVEVGVLYMTKSDEKILVLYPTAMTSTSFTFTVPDGVTEIASYAFGSNYHLSGCVLPESLKIIDDLAFNNTGLTTITIPSQVEYINRQVFHASLMVEVTMSGKVEHINRNKTFGSFSGIIYNNPTLRVPMEYLDYYQQSPWTEWFASIEGYTPGNTITTSINSVDSIHATDQPMYNLSGQRVGKDYKGIVIHNGKKVVR